MPSKAMLKQGERRRRAILKFLRDYKRRTGYAPTIQEIGDATGLASPNSIKGHLRRLEEEGYIVVTPRLARAISLVENAPDRASAA